MKNLFRTLCVVAVAFIGSFTLVSAQQMPPIPMDQNVKIGKLDNGLTYYLRHNEKPENRAEFYIAQKVGSILEEPNQRGLAHFLEHMCFNGTKNFPGNEKGLGIVAWCESKGIKFGYDLNAATGVEKTIYNISNVPTTNKAVVDSCLLILHDWSNDVLLEDKEIDKERGVIHEEWRTRNKGMLRLITESQPVLYPNSKYADCMPIGTIDVIDNFKYQTLRDYYEKWYRPDLQAIIIVGDIDVNAMEAQIKTVFADVPKPVNAAERTIFDVSDNDEPLIFIGKDKEIDNPSINFFFKHPATSAAEKANMGYLVQNYIIDLANMMLDTRFNELRQSANAPFLDAGCDYSDYFLCNAREAYMIGVDAKADGMHTAMDAVLTELERARRFGFTEGEFVRARANYLKHLETAYNERANTKNAQYVNEYVANFTDGEPIPGIEFEYTVANQILPNLGVAIINETIKQLITEKNQAVMIAAPDKEGVDLPTKEEVAAALKGMKDLKVEAYVDKVSNEPLMKEAPKGGKIVSETQDGIYGTTVITLSNGVKVYIKKTDFKADEIQMRGFSMGGLSLYGNEEKVNLNQLNSIAALGGIGNFSMVDLQKVLAGKKANAFANVTSDQQEVKGSCSPKDFETMMQLTYLRFTAPRKDMDAYTSYMTRLKAQLEGNETNPMTALNDTIFRVMYNNHPRFVNLKADMLDKINYDRILEIYKERFSDASDFKFFLVGNVDLEAIRPLIEQYLGGLPGAGRKEKAVDHKMYVSKGIINNVFGKEQETPMATNFMLYTGKCAYNLKNDLLMSFYGQIMDIIFTEEIREKEGGTYGVQAGGQLQKFPTEEALFQIVYQTAPEKYEHLNAIIDKLMDEMATKGPDAEKLNKVKEFVLKQHANNQKENGYWMSNLNEYFYTGVDATQDYEAIVNGITATDIQQFAKNLMKQGNRIKVIMTVPEKK